MIAALRTRRNFRLILLAAAAAVLLANRLASHAVAGPIITNPNFTANASGFTSFPGYVGGSNPAAITGWSSSGNVGINPGSGAGNPFYDNGSGPAQVAFIQSNGTGNTSTLSQAISGFTPGASYAVTFNYNARNCCSDNPHLSVNVGSANTQIDNIQPVGGANPFYQVTVPFTAGAATQTLALTASNHGNDGTAVVGNFAIQQVHQVAIANASFEANSNPGVGYGPITGWNETSAWGTNPGSAGNFFIPGRGGANAAPPDGSQVAFSQGNGTLSQTISGLWPGNTYTLTFFDGHRNGDSGPGDTLTASMNGAPLGTNTPGVNEYTPLTYTFLATATSELLTFTHGNVTADQSIAIDNVSIFTPVPEPSSFVLGGLGVVGLIAAARRRRQG